ncbi:glycosyltransferase family 4 protein [Halomarina ordinaria]|uniref:Glycosyltransferase family 4 protein n=1 Tax=Halomarina ordinaria TaxID=3033939 RepID=A0ABD5U3I6_9EURY|nr:glycosyltransferase family 4 protein [Halomarina sp. PSRA2]
MNDNPHICFISPWLYRYIEQEDGKASGGAERQQHLIASELRERGYDVSVIVGDFGQPERYEVDGFDLWKGCPTDVAGPREMLNRVYQLRKTMKAVDADVYYVRGGPRLHFVTLLLAKSLGKDRLFCIANDSDVDPEYLERRYGRAFTKLYLRSIGETEYLVAQTERQRARIREQVGVDPTVIPNGYDLPPRSELLEQDDREYVLWIGTSDRDKKKPLRLLELADSLPEEEFVMVCQQESSDAFYAELAGIVEDRPNMEFVPGVAPDAIHDYYREASLLVNTSDYEGFPNTFLEAWRYAVPVVSQRFSLDVFEEGIGIESGSMKRLVEDVGRLQRDVDERREMGERARAYVEEHYQLEAVVDRYEEVLNGTRERGKSKSVVSSSD